LFKEEYLTQLIILYLVVTASLASGVTFINYTKARTRALKEVVGKAIKKIDDSFRSSS